MSYICCKFSSTFWINVVSFFRVVLPLAWVSNGVYEVSEIFTAYRIFFVLPGPCDTFLKNETVVFIAANYCAILSFAVGAYIGSRANFTCNPGSINAVINKEAFAV